jgi:UDP-N-acetylmuramoylalanine--D-glutamate ligase
LASHLEEHGAKLRRGAGYLKDLDADVIFRTPGLRPDLPELTAAVKNGAVLTSEMEVFFDVCPCRTIGVTGSDGKTTTTSIIAELLSAAGHTVHVGGNIGTPLLNRADDMAKGDFAVLELSSFKLYDHEKKSVRCRRDECDAQPSGHAPGHGRVR